MNKLQQIGCLVMLLLMTLTARAQDSSPVKVDFESKIIYADSLALPKGLNVGALVRLLPELLQRPGDRTLSNYEVQVDGVGVGGSADAVLSVLQLADIEKLEVKNSPTSSDLNGGMSGSINFVLKPIDGKKKGTSGKVALGVSSESSVMTDVLLDYRSEKLSVRGMIFGEGYSAGKSTEVLSYGVPDMTSTDNFWNQMARAMITYTPNVRNKFELTLTEGFYQDKNKIDDLSAVDSIQDGKIHSITFFERKSMLNARLNYHYQISQSQKLKLSAQYSHMPTFGWIEYEQGERESEGSLYENVAEGSAELSGQWKLGTKGSWSYKVGTKGLLAKSNKQLMPLAELTLLYGPLRIKTGYEYQWNKEGRSDWTGRLVMAYQLNPTNRVRLLMNRQLNRERMISKEIGAEYITNHIWGKHQLTANVGVNYCNSMQIDADNTNYKSINFMLVYQYDIFLLPVTANIFSHAQEDGITNDENAKGKDYKYFNFSIMPSLNLKSGWRTALNLRYYSKVKTNVDEQGNCVSLQMNVGKSWGPWTMYAYGRLSLTGRVSYYTNVVNITTLTPLVPTSAGCGVSWSF